MRENRNGGTTKFGLSGDHELGFSGEVPMSPRAASEQMLMTPRTAMGKKDAKKASFISAPELHGEGPVAIASNGKVHASIGINGKLAIWQAKGVKEGQSLMPLCQVVLQLPPDLEAKAKAAEAKSKVRAAASIERAGGCEVHRAMRRSSAAFTAVLTHIAC